VLICLSDHLQVAEARREAGLSAYVMDQLSYSKFWKLLEFGDKLDSLLKVGALISVASNLLRPLSCSAPMHGIA
jgi:hypothetical protein